MNLNFVTPEKNVVFNIEVDEVIVPGERGELNILPGHAPLMATLGIGLLRYRLQGETQFQVAAISWGYCEVGPLGVRILADTAETKEDLSMDRAKDALAKSRKQLANSNLSPEQILKFQRKEKRAQVRISLMDL